MNYFVSLYAKSNQGTMKKLLIMALTLSMTACSMIQSDDDKATEIAVQWGEAYFNCDFHAAEKLSTPESLRWLQFAASNTTQEDLDLLKQQAADVEATDYIPEANDTLRVVELRVDHYLSKNLSVGVSQQMEEAVFHITTVKRNGSWQVRMAGLPRSEKQSRD